MLHVVCAEAPAPSSDREERDALVSTTALLKWVEDLACKLREYGFDPDAGPGIAGC